MKPGPRGRREHGGKYVAPADFTDWHHLFREYFKGLAEHKRKPRGGRGSFQDKFCEEYGLSRFEINRLQRSYRIAYIEPGPYQQEAQELFQRFIDGEYGPDSLRSKINLLTSDKKGPDPQVYRSAIEQIVVQLRQLRAILDKLEQQIPKEITDDEVHELAREIWNGRQGISTWYNSHIRLVRPQVLKRMEGKRP